MADNVVPEFADDEGYGSAVAAKREDAELFGWLIRNGARDHDVLVALRICGPTMDDGFRARLRDKLVSLAENSADSMQDRPLGEGLDDGANPEEKSSDSSER